MKTIHNVKQATMSNDFKQHMECNKRITVTLMLGAFLFKWPRLVT